MLNSKTIIIADSKNSERLRLTKILENEGYAVSSTTNLSTLWTWIAKGKGDLIIIDSVMPDGSTLEIIPRIMNIRPNLPIIVTSKHNTMKTALQVNEYNVYEYVPKPYDIEYMQDIIKKGIEYRAISEDDNDNFSTDQYEGSPIIGRSEKMQEVFKTIARLTQTDLAVLIIGASGTGKELVAKSLHDFSARRQKNFVAVNMAAIPKELIESELFGHEKGAFTGAVTKSTGKFEYAKGGTLFLDEIGDMPKEAQTRLLRVLQEGEFTRVGGSEVIKTDVRIISATNRKLQEQISNGSFREDLYYRLNVVPINLPKLSERKDDISDLVNFFLNKAYQKGLPRKKIEYDALMLFKNYDWPGNVRELENFIMRITILHSQEVISKIILEDEIENLNKLNFEKSDTILETEFNFKYLVDSHLSNMIKDSDTQITDLKNIYQSTIQEVEIPLIINILTECNFNQIKASEVLGINRNTLRKKMKLLGINKHNSY